MKTTVTTKNAAQAFKYPCLMKCIEADLVVLFNESSCGTVVHRSGAFHSGSRMLGEVADDFDMNLFYLLDGSVTLSNDE